MKTLKSFSASIFTLSAALVLTLTGCQKDELTSPNAAIPPAIDQAANIPHDLRFQVLSINHQAGPQKSAADYIVTVMSDGQFIFEGRKNVGTIGIRTFMLSNEQMIALGKFFSDNNFEKIIQEQISKDLSTVRVAYKQDAKTRVSTRISNENEASRLVTFNNKLEDFLNVKGFTTVYRTDQSTFPIEHN